MGSASVAGAALTLPSVGARPLERPLSATRSTPDDLAWGGHVPPAKAPCGGGGRGGRGAYAVVGGWGMHATTSERAVRPSCRDVPAPTSGDDGSGGSAATAQLPPPPTVRGGRGVAVMGEEGGGGRVRPRRPWLAAPATDHGRWCQAGTEETKAWGCGTLQGDRRLG